MRNSDGLDEVSIGRGPQRARVREWEGGVARLRLTVPDGFMSSQHLRLVRVGERWRAEDAGSKNGSFLGEAPLDEPALLADRALLTTGRAIFLFLRAAGASADAPDADLSGTSLADAPLTTLHAPFARELARLRRVAAAPVPTLVQGETGTGKELVARAIHRASGRSGPFVAVNCGALSPSLAASELFGARKGAFSGASESRRGLVRSADGGTLFLDEIAELPLEAQAILLRVLQEREVLALGAERPVKVDVKLVAATHQDLDARVAEGRFREDLCGRVAGYRVTLPPLRRRPEDLGLIVGNLLARAKREDARLTPEAGRALLRHDWPRNVRELEHTLTAALAVAGDAPVGLVHLPEALRGEAEQPGSPAASPEDARGELEALLRAHEGNVSAVARALGTSRSQVRRLAARHGLRPEAFRPEG